MEPRRRRRSRNSTRFRGRGLFAVATVSAVALLIVGCSGSDDSPDVPTISPQTPIAAPLADPGAPPAGVVVPVPAAGGALAFCPSTSQLALLSSDGRSVLFYPTAGLAPGAAPGRTVELSDKASGFLSLIHI